MKNIQQPPHSEAPEIGDLQVISDADEEMLDVESTEWFNSMKAEMTSGKVLRSYRNREDLTQEELDKRIGGVPRQHISGMESGRRPIGPEMAKRLAEVLRFDYRKIL